MTEENIASGPAEEHDLAAEADEHTTVPQTDRVQAWEMPKPVFRSSTGVSPRSSRLQHAELEDDTEDAVSDLDEVEPPISAARRGSGHGRYMLIGLALMAALAAILVAAVYYLFVNTPPELTTP
jgi:hypothetical protein